MGLSTGLRSEASYKFIASPVYEGDEKAGVDSSIPKRNNAIFRKQDKNFQAKPSNKYYPIPAEDRRSMSKRLSFHLTIVITTVHSIVIDIE